MKADRLIPDNIYTFGTESGSETVKYIRPERQRNQILFLFLTMQGSKILLTEKNIETNIKEKNE